MTHYMLVLPNVVLYGQDNMVNHFFLNLLLYFKALLHYTRDLYLKTLLLKQPRVNSNCFITHLVHSSMISQFSSFLKYYIMIYIIL